MQKTKKLLSMLLAFVMVLGVAAPVFAAGELAQTTKSVTVHKLIPVDKDTKAEDIKTQIEALTGDKKYTGRELNLATDVNKAKEIKDVYFIWTNDKNQVIDASGNVIKKGETEITITENKKLPEGIKEADLKDALAGLTGEKGKEFDTSKLPSGTYKIYEIHSLSKYVGEGGKTLTGTLAVPVEITLPLNDVVDAHVYPKNTEEAPKIDKNFDNADNKDAKGIKTTDLTDQNKDVEIKTDADKFQREKGTAKKQLGDKVPYKVVTEIPAQTKWATAKWHDEMTEGLTYNKDLSIELKKGETTVTLEKETDYTIEDGNNGFILEFTPAGLEKLNNQTEKQTVTLKYTATLNEKAVPDVEESNDVTFHYGNNPGHGNTPIPNKPDNGKITFTKTWDGTAPENATIEVKLYNANTGAEVETKTLNKDNNWTVEFENLDNETEYKVVETAVAGYEAEYSKGAVGVLGVKNWKSNNPTPLNPSEPKVVTGGKKFVKTNDEDKASDKLERLANAEFVVKNADNKYLANKSQATSEEDQKALNAAKEKYENAVKAWNDAVEKNPNTADNEIQVTIGEETITGKTAAEAKIAELFEAYKTALKADENAYEWVDSKDAPNVVKLISGDEGQFEIKGLAYGTYKLEEIKAPAGYALPTGGGNFEFTVEKGSYAGNDTEIQYNKENTDNGYGMQIKNSNVTIPQTGGIGTIIFAAVGIALMVSAVVAMKKREAEEI